MDIRMEDRLFICYSRKDEDFVLKLAANLKNHGVPIWLDQWNIPKGANWPRAIDKALFECRRLLVILSPSAIDSDEVQAEWYTALDEKKVVIPILHQPCRIPFRLKLIQHIDFTSRTPDDLAGLKEVLHALGMAEEAPVKPLVQIENKQETASDWHNKGIALRKLGKYDEAIKAYDRAIDLDPKYASAWNNKGIALDELGKYDEAIKAYDKAIDLDPKYTSAWYNKGIALDELGKYDEAIKAYDRAIDLDPKDALAWHNKGVALKRLGRTKEADAAYVKAKKLVYKGGS